MVMVPSMQWFLQPFYWAPPEEDHIGNAHKSREIAACCSIGVCFQWFWFRPLSQGPNSGFCWFRDCILDPVLKASPQSYTEVFSKQNQQSQQDKDTSRNSHLFAGLQGFSVKDRYGQVVSFKILSFLGLPHFAPSFWLFRCMV